MSVTLEMFHALEKRVTTAEERLHGGSESFAENRKEIRDLRRQVGDMREAMIELVGRDGAGGAFAQLSDLATSLRQAVDRLEEVVTGLTPDVQRLAGLGPDVTKLKQIYWKVGFVSLFAGGAASAITTVLIHFWPK